MQFSYFENSQMTFKERLFQIYAFITAQKGKDKNNNFEPIFHSHETNAMNNLNLNGYFQFIKQLIFMRLKRKIKFGFPRFHPCTETQTIDSNHFIHK